MVQRRRPLTPLKRWKWYALAAYIVMLIVNGLAGSTILLGGQNTAAVSDKFANLFAPASITFAIWGVIYVVFAFFFARIFGIWRTKRPHIKEDTLYSVVRLFTLTSVINVAWLLSWQYEVIWLSVLLMIVLLVTLGWIHQLLTKQKRSVQETVALRVPFSLYFGWITVATIANITTWLVSINWSGWGVSEAAWMIIVLITGAVIGVVTALLRQDWLFLAVFVWAYGGILYKHISTEGFNGDYPIIVTTISILLPVIITMMSLIGLRLLATPKSYRTSRR